MNERRLTASEDERKQDWTGLKVVQALTDIALKSSLLLVQYRLVLHSDNEHIQQPLKPV